MAIDWKAHARRTVEALGADWTLKPASGAPAYTVRGIFVSAPVTVLDDAGHAGVGVAHPTLTAMAEDLPCAAVDDVLEHSEHGVYAIADKPRPEQPAGKITLILKKEAP